MFNTNLPNSDIIADYFINDESSVYGDVSLKVFGRMGRL